MEIIVYMDKKFKNSRLLGYTAPGWYFLDETATRYLGPYRLAAKARKAQQHYLDILTGRVKKMKQGKKALEWTWIKKPYGWVISNGKHLVAEIYYYRPIRSYTNIRLFRDPRTGKSWRSMKQAKEWLKAVNQNIRDAHEISKT